MYKHKIKRSSNFSSSSELIVLMACTILDLISDDMSALNRDNPRMTSYKYHKHLQTADWLTPKFAYRYLYSFLNSFKRHRSCRGELAETLKSSSNDDAHITQACFVTSSQLELSLIHPYLEWLSFRRPSSLVPHSWCRILEHLWNWSVQVLELYGRHAPFASLSCDLRLKQTQFPKHFRLYIHLLCTLISCMMFHGTFNLLNIWISWFKEVHV